MPTTRRIAILAGLLALIVNLAVLGFVYWRTHDQAIATLRQQVVEQGAVIGDVYRSGGQKALTQAIDDTLGYDDPQTGVGLFDARGRQIVGNISATPALHPLSEGYRITLLRVEDDPVPREAGLLVHRLRGGQWLLTGRTVGDGLALRDTLERSLLIAMVLAAVLGVACGVIVAEYVGRRVGEIAAVTNRITARDMSERVPLFGAGDSFDRLSLQINAMLDRISLLMGELQILTDTLAHDLRTPVSRLRAAAHAAGEATDRGERERQLTSVVRQSDALMRILTTVLEISRSEARTGRNQFAWFDARDLCAELVEMYEPVAEEAGATLKLTEPSGPTRLFGHRQLLAQAISNLIENALRYAPGSAIMTEVAKGGDTLVITVADHGPGIPRDRLDEARRRFGRLDTSRSAEGAGLGLALVEAIAHLHGGQLDLDDNAPGLRASLRLPGAATPEAD